MLDVRAVVAGRATGRRRRDTEDGPVRPDLPGPVSEVRRAAGAIARTLPAGRSVLETPDLAGDRLAAFAEGLALGTYRWTEASEPRPLPSRVDLLGADDRDGAIARGLDSAAATSWARDLANTPAGTKTPAWLGAQAEKQLAPLGVSVEVHDEQWLAEHRFGGILAVGGGSVAPPRLIEATWKPRGAPRDVHLVIVGKGIVFDTGGINRKPGAAMRMMHTDMSGGAAALGALRAVAQRRLRVRVTALVPAAENAFGGASYRPSDVVRHYGGRTSEIRNTDAEGRLVLADALAYAAARLKPTHLVDIATLTGAMKLALGLRTGGLLATSDPLADALLAAGDTTDEPLWRLPLDDGYAGTLRSDIADANNAPGNPGGITAALFLKPFAADVPWAHLDIAGPARAGEDDGVITQGATGFGVRLLAAWAATHADR
ncbi:leucyl aminopeptidase family protein [Jatrophihabitans fulvus]